MYTYMQGFSPFYSPYAVGFMLALAPLFLLLVLWTIIIKGYALWVAARSGQKGWFVALLVVNTVGILELIYLIWFSPKGSNRLHSSPASTPAEKSSPQA